MGGSPFPASRLFNSYKKEKRLHSAMFSDTIYEQTHR
jgi:hypothetical protein